MAEVIIIEGFYQGKDLYVKNPNSSKGVGFCVYEVQVNGDVTADEINSNAFVVDLHTFGYEIGTPISIEIRHHEGCKPKILNPDAVLPQSSFEIVSVDVDARGRISWVTSKEMAEMPYVIQQFKWNKWITIGEVIGTGRMDENSYSFQAQSHTGTNIYRVGQRNSKGEGRYSDEIRYDSPQSEPVELLSEKVSNMVSFSKRTQFEIFDVYGRLVKRGYERNVLIDSLEKGTYYINYDRSFGKTFSKR